MHIFTFCFHGSPEKLKIQMENQVASEVLILKTGLDLMKLSHALLYDQVKLMIHH